MFTKLMRSGHDSHLKKRHWVVGSLFILISSWITHTTTATLSDGRPIQNQALGFTDLASPANSFDAMNLDATDNMLDGNAEQLGTNLSAPDSVAKNSPFRELSHTVKKGETLGIIFKGQKLDLAIPHYIAQHPTAKRLTQLSIGSALRFRFDHEDVLKELIYPVNALQELHIKLAGTAVDTAEIIDLPYITLQHNVSAEISSNLYDTALEAGLSNNLVMEMVQIFGWDIDFVQDIRLGDTFHVIYSDYNLNGQKLADGNILAAEFTTQGNTYRAIRYLDKGGTTSFYTPQGESMLGTFLRSPVEFSRISSRFGKRKHPILKKWRSHKGVDYAARRGTPIRATADGKVILAQSKGGYGKTVVLRHAGRFSTLYAHMTGFAKGVRSGSKVKQGQVIGYIGSTGLATGPHLHYEFRVDGVHRNPLTYKTPKASSIAAAERDSFNQLANKWLAKLDHVSESYQIAKQTLHADTPRLAEAL